MKPETTQPVVPPLTQNTESALWPEGMGDEGFGGCESLGLSAPRGDGWRSVPGQVPSGACVPL